LEDSDGFYTIGENLNVIPSAGLLERRCQTYTGDGVKETEAGVDFIDV